MPVQIDPSVRLNLPSAKFAGCIYEGVRVAASSEVLRSEIRGEQERVLSGLTLASLYGDPGIVESRQAFRALGLDPSRYRPSQEALLRRILQGKEMYCINSGVDVCNLLSLRFRMPMGLYDQDKIAGVPILRIGTPADVYAALNGRDVSCEDKLILCDEEGALGGPYVDSVRSTVTEATRNFLHVVYFCYEGLTDTAFTQMQETFLRYHAGGTKGYKFLE